MESYNKMDSSGGCSLASAGIYWLSLQVTGQGKMPPTRSHTMGSIEHWPLDPKLK